MRKLVWASLTVAFVAGCGAVLPPPTPAPTARPTARPLGPGEFAVPVELWRPINGMPVACAGVGYEGEYRLHGARTDPRFVWMTFPDGTRHELAWPLGYSARFSPELELLDERGQIVAREGSLLTGGCETPQSGVLWVTTEGLTVDEMFNGSRSAGSGPP